MVSLPRHLAMTIGLFFALTASLHARPPHKQALADYYGTFLTKSLNNCATCHLPDPPGAKDELSDTKPHNPFGARLKKVRTELQRADKKTDIPSRLEAIANEDSDGDGVGDVCTLV